MITYITRQAPIKIKSGFYLFYIVTALLLIVGKMNAQQLRRDTVLAVPDSNKTSWQYKMQQSDDKWSILAVKKDFQLFYKAIYDRANRKNLNIGSISFYGNATLFWLNDIREVEIAAAGITAENAGDFIYHVTVNDSIEVVPWSKPLNLRTNKHITYAYLGKFETANKFVKLELYNTKNYKERAVWVLNGLYMPTPAVHRLVLNYNNKFLFKPFMQVYVPDSKQRYYSLDKKEEQIQFKWSDSIDNVQVSMRNTVQNDMYNVYLKRMVDKGTDTVYISNNWRISAYSPDPELSINSSYFNRPGNYEIIVVPEAPDEFGINSMNKAASIPFIVMPAETRSYSDVQVLVIVGTVILVAAFLFLVYYYFNRRRHAIVKQHKEMATVELNSVRSQLNPHFIFNALAGIQNLMNKGDINATNHYLSRFSRITRSVLEDRNKGSITIDEELGLLEDYLQMEQMRFGFTYNIHVDEKIDRANTEIPSMLLQPYIENAIKHGVSSLKHAGMIAIAFLLKSGSLVMEVKDNGKGYDTKAKAPGNGSLLTQKRVDLINQINRRDAIKVSEKSDASGTIISIELHEWV